ncbi:MAG: hypothetical protein WA631_10980 [Nitrososphaeraceae archaeon]
MVFFLVEASRPSYTPYSDFSYKVTQWDKYVKVYPTYIEMIEVKSLNVNIPSTLTGLERRITQDGLL